jgi:hypothetical protein
MERYALSYIRPVVTGLTKVVGVSVFLWENIHFNFLLMPNGLRAPVSKDSVTASIS